MLPWHHSMSRFSIYRGNKLHVGKYAKYGFDPCEFHCLFTYPPVKEASDAATDLFQALFPQIELSACCLYAFNDFLVLFLKSYIYSFTAEQKDNVQLFLT
jgi:hypothetical protein